MLVQPSAVEFHRIEQCIAAAGSNDYDMEIVNNLYRDSAFILPHRPYNLVTGEFARKTTHPIWATRRNCGIRSKS